MNDYEKLNQQLDRLASLSPCSQPVLSVYLNAEADQHGRDHFGPFLRKELKAAANGYPQRSEARRSVERDAERIEAFVRDELRSSANGAALFSCSGEGDLFEAAQFEVAVGPNRIHVGGEPHLYPFARTMERARPYGVLVGDTNTARLFVFGLGRTLDSGTVESPRPEPAEEPVRSQARHQRRMEEFDARHARESLAAFEAMAKRWSLESVFLAGDEVIVPLLKEYLGQWLEQRVAGVLRLDITTSEHEIFKTAEEAVRNHRAAENAARAGRALDAWRAGGLGTAQLERVKKALENGQVRELILDATRAEADFDAGPLVTAALRTGARVRFVDDPQVLAQAGGVCAELRYVVEPAAGGERVQGGGAA